MVKAMEVSPITDTIYYGTIKNDEWVDKEDVTNMAIKAVFGWFMRKFEKECTENGSYELRFPGIPYVLTMKKEKN